jgi:hypothetical protein
MGNEDRGEFNKVDPEGRQGLDNFTYDLFL